MSELNWLKRIVSILKYSVDIVDLNLKLKNQKTEIQKLKRELYHFKAQYNYQFGIHILKENKELSVTFLTDAKHYFLALKNNEMAKKCVDMINKPIKK